MHPRPLSLPKSWSKSVQGAMVQVIALAQLAFSYTRSWAANCPNERLRESRGCPARPGDRLAE
jgi:hypothetical protein